MQSLQETFYERTFEETHAKIPSKCQNSSEKSQQDKAFKESKIAMYEE